VVKQGDVGDSFFIVLHGALSVSVEGDDGMPRVVGAVHAGEHFGEIALLSEHAVRSVGGGGEC
jgi:CRP-like cAMP-binding protein